MFTGATDTSISLSNGEFDASISEGKTAGSVSGKGSVSNAILQFCLSVSCLRFLTIFGPSLKILDHTFDLMQRK